MRRLLAALLLAILAACGDNTPAPYDHGAGADAATLTDAPLVDAVIPLTWADFAIVGCPDFDPSVPACTVSAPTSLRFSALAPAPVDSYLWDFGDGSALATDASPVHVYELPGTYTVTLTVGGAGGTAEASKDGFVVVAPAALGGACPVAATCSPGDQCVCASGAGCPPSLAGGLCTRDCSAGAPCPAGAVCADLGAGSPTPSGWRRALCLSACTVDQDCRPGFRCRELLAGAGAASGWVKGCFPPDLLVDDGSPCKDADGILDDARCASGHCADLGALGLCALPCPTGDECASTATCAQLTSSGQHLCVARCADHTCVSDPWLACEAPDATGDLGFTVSGSADAAGYCTPKRCTSATECGIGGACIASGGASFCGP